MLELGGGDIAVGTVKAVEAGVLDSPMSINIHAQDKVLGIRDRNGACRYLEFGNLPIPEDIKDFHRQKVAERKRPRAASWTTTLPSTISGPSARAD